MKIEPFALERWMTTHELNVDYDIAESGIQPLTVDDLLAFEPAGRRAATLERLLSMPLGYSAAPGTPELRALLAATYRDCDPDQILVTTGAIEANFLLFNVLLEAGDHVVAPYPAYQQLYSVPRAIGCDVSLWRVRPENDYCFDLDELRALLRPTTRLIVLNTPHNPTGAMLSADELREIYALAESVDALILSDDAYRWLEIPGGDPIPPPMFDLGERAICTGTFSKPLGLPGLRLGWMAGPREIVTRCWGLRDYVSLSPGKLNDALGVLALTHRERIVERNRPIITANLAAASAWVARHADVLAWKPPRGGLLALLRYQLPLPSLELSNRLATEYSVMLAPGSAFGYERHLRIGIGQDPPIFRAGLEAAARCFEAVSAAH